MILGPASARPRRKRCIGGVSSSRRNSFYLNPAQQLDLKTSTMNFGKYLYLRSYNLQQNGRWCYDVHQSLYSIIRAVKGQNWQS